jgi:hypothetical protein
VRKVPELLASVALQVLGRRASVVVDRLGVGVGLKAGTLVGLVVAGVALGLVGLALGAGLSVNEACLGNKIGFEPIEAGPGLAVVVLEAGAVLHRDFLTKQENFDRQWQGFQHLEEGLLEEVEHLDEATLAISHDVASEGVEASLVCLIGTTASFA